jgi:DNA-directed RNA polymerase specialized sigma24 family protein
VKNAIPSETGGEADLVRLIMAGNQLAEKELVQRYSRGMSIIIRHRVKNAADVEDLCQERFRAALEKIRRGEVREPEKLSGFICGLARNLAIGHLRRLSGWESDNADATPLIDHAPNPYDKLLNKERAVKEQLSSVSAPGFSGRVIICLPSKDSPSKGIIFTSPNILSQ